jgi:ribA/ribD-fused uncharacterized protein
MTEKRKVWRRWAFCNFGTAPGGLPGFDADDTNTYPTVEHVFQAAKTTDPAIRATIAAAKTPSEAKRLGRAAPLRDGWIQMRDTVMWRALEIRWGREPYRSRLLATGDQPLVEWTTWHDTYWGVCTCPKHNGAGENMLGRLLVMLRDQFRSQLRAEEA